MDLKKILTFQKKTPEQEHFLALEVHESLIKTAVWSMEGNQPSIVSKGSFELWDSEESLVNGVDASLTLATKGLSKKPTKVILGLPEPWLKDDKIHPTKTNLIKHLLTELGLKPIGLVTSIQAIIHHLKKKEGVPPSAILLEIYPDKVTVVVVKLGKVEALEEVGRSGELNKDVQEGLSRLNLEQFPPRFVLTNGSNLENEQQQLLSYPWQDKLPFLHLPKVEVLPAEFSIEAIALAGGSEAANAMGIVTEEVSAPTPTPVSNPNQNLSDLGFQVEDSQPSPPKPSANQSVPPKDESSIAEPPAAIPAKEIKTQPRTDTLITRFKGVAGSLANRFAGSRKKSKLIIITALLFVPIILTSAYLSFASARVIVTVKETPFMETIDINFSREFIPDSINLALKSQSIIASASESVSTTGEALVGENATGNIILYNRTNESVTVKSGTKIESDNLSFLLNTSTTIASKSADLINGGEKYGKSDNLSITATGIGTRYNLSKQTQFSVGSYSRTVIYAVAENDFSGGSSRTVKAVSEDDYQSLLEATSQKVITEIDSKVRAQDPSLSSLVIGEVSYSKTEFSKEVGDEASSVDLDLAGEVMVLLYSDSEVIEQLSTQVLPKTNPGMKLSSNGTIIKILPPQEESANVYQTQASIQGLLIPVIDHDRYLSQLKGKSISKLKNILETIPGYKNTTVIIKPNIPFLSNYIPFNESKVSLSVVTSN